MTSPEFNDWRTYPESSLSRVLQAALEAFAEAGYHGTTIRVLASRAGLSVPGLYHHYNSKQELLMELMASVMDELLARTRAALAGAGEAAEDQFDAVVESLLRFHMFRQQAAFVGSSEIRSLEPENRKRYVAMRLEQQRILDEIVVAGARSGVFGTAHPEDAGRAVSTMCIGVASWYRPDGSLGVDELVDRYGEIARGAVGRRT